MTVSVREPAEVRPSGAENRMRDCPTLAGDYRALITHRIETGPCMQRQREFYHKCHRCLFRGEAADFVVEDKIHLEPVAGTGVPKETVELPRATSDH